MIADGERTIVPSVLSSMQVRNDMNRRRENVNVSRQNDTTVWSAEPRLGFTRFCAPAQASPNQPPPKTRSSSSTPQARPASQRASRTRTRVFRSRRRRTWHSGRMSAGARGSRWYTDIGWMMGPWLIYGALINGATICIYDGAPDYPDARPNVGVLRQAQGRDPRHLADARSVRSVELRSTICRRRHDLSSAYDRSFRLDRRAVESGTVVVAFRKGRRFANCRSSTTAAAPRSRAAS